MCVSMLVIATEFFKTNRVLRWHFILKLFQNKKDKIPCTTLCPKKDVTRFYFLPIRDKWKV